MPTDSKPHVIYRLEEDDGMLNTNLMTDDPPSSVLRHSYQSLPVFFRSGSPTLRLFESSDQKRTIQLFVYYLCPPPFGSDTSFPHVQMMMAPPPAPVDVGSVGAAFAPRTAGWMTVDEPIGNGTDPEQDSIRAVNACIEHILLTYPGNKMQNFEFKGRLDTESATVAVFCAKAKEINTIPTLRSRYHSTSLPVYDSPTSGLNPYTDMWANLDEIMYRKSWRGVPVDPFVTQLFHQYAFLSEIVDTQTHLPVPVPMSLYLCDSRISDSKESWGKGTYTNRLRDSTLCIEPTIEHPLFGNHWYFTEVPQGGENLARYSVFVDDPLTHALFRDIGDGLTDADRTYLIQKYGAMSTMPTTLTVGNESNVGNTPVGNTSPIDGDWPVKTTFFHEGGVPIWCIRDRHAFVRI